MARSRSAVLGAAEAYRRASLLQRDDPPAARALLVAALDSLGQTRQGVVALSNTYRTLWLRENRTYALDRVLDRYAEQAAGLENTERRLYEALSDFDKGHFLPPPVEVRLAVEETQGHYFREWLMSGPLPNPSGHPGATEDYLVAMGGERAAEPGVAVEWAYDGKTYRWHRAASPQHAVVDLAALYPQQNENVVAYAHAMIHAPTPRRVRATLGSADGIEVILNGERVHHNPVKRTLMLDEEAVWLDLREGRNHLLLKISQTDGEWGFSFRLPDHTIRSSKNRYYIVD